MLCYIIFFVDFVDLFLLNWMQIEVLEQLPHPEDIRAIHVDHEDGGEMKCDESDSDVDVTPI